MLYILIIFAYGSHDVAVTTAEINGEKNCLAAAAKVNGMSKSFTAICVERGR